MKIMANRHKSAFTLIEIMIVSAIIGIIVAIAIPNFMSSREAAIKNKCLANAKQIESALTRASLDTNVSINSLSEEGIKAIIEPDYIKKMPQCERGTYSTDASGTVHCSAHSPAEGGG